MATQTDFEPIFCNPRVCFENALANGTLNMDPEHPRYVGEFMYMHSESDGNGGHVDSFKSSITRSYITTPRGAA